MQELDNYEIKQKVVNKELKLEDNDFALILAIRDLTSAIERLRIRE